MENIAIEGLDEAYLRDRIAQPDDVLRAFVGEELWKKILESCGEPRGMFAEMARWRERVVQFFFGSPAVEQPGQRPEFHVALHEAAARRASLDAFLRGEAKKRAAEHQAALAAIDGSAKTAPPKEEDPATLKVPELHKRLEAAGVEFPKKATKAELLELLAAKTAPPKEE
jgi:hypothetical protein